MTISIVLSTYNGEKYIQEQLESLLHQTQLPDEVLIRDDGSTDNTVNICERFIAENGLDSWKVSRNQKNLGWAENFLMGFKQAQGEIIFPCDQDDIWLGNKIELMTKIIEKDDTIGLLICGHIKQIEDETSSVRENKSFNKSLTRLPFDSKMIFVDYPGCTYCFRKSFYEDIEEYCFKGYPHDALLLRMGRLMQKAVYYDIPGIYWRRHMTNATGKPVRDNKEMSRRLVYYIDCLELMKKYCNDHSGFEKECKLINENIDFYKTRQLAFKNRKLVGKDSLFSCLKYLKFYPTPKSILGDVIRLIH